MPRASASPCPQGLKSVDGSVLAQPYTFTFNTPRARAAGVRSPPAGWQWVTPEQHFVLLLNQPVLDFDKALHILVGPEKTEWPFSVSKVEAVDKGQETPGRLRTLVKSRQTRYTVVPSRPLPKDSPLTLTLSGTLRGAEGPLTLGGDFSRTSGRTGRWRVVAAVACDSRARRCPYGPLVLLTNNPAVLSTLKERLTPPSRGGARLGGAEVSPGTEGEAPSSLSPAAFVRGRRTNSPWPQGSATNSAKPPRPPRREFRTTDLEPGFDPGPDVALLEAKGDGALPVEVTNLSKLEARLWALSPAEMARFLGARHPERTPVPQGTPVVSTLDTAGSPQPFADAPLPGADLLGGKATLFFAELTAPELTERWNRVRRVTGQMTDLVVHAKLGPASSAVWVTRLSDGKPVQGATLELYDRQGSRALAWQE